MTFEDIEILGDAEERLEGGVLVLRGSCLCARHVISIKLSDLVHEIGLGDASAGADGEWEVVVEVAAIHEDAGVHVDVVLKNALYYSALHGGRGCG